MSVRSQFTVVRGLHVQVRHEEELIKDLNELDSKFDVDGLINAQPDQVVDHIADLGRLGLRQVVNVFNRVRNSAMGVGVTAEFSPRALEDAPDTIPDEDRTSSVERLNSLITSIQSRRGLDI